MNWSSSLKAKIKLNEPLRNKNTFKIGGEAKFFCQPECLDDLKSIIKQAKKYHIPVFILGAGSNLLVADRGVKGMVLRLNAPFFKRVLKKQNCLEVGSGVMLAQLIKKAASYGLSAAEFLAGIPGTVGGALAMNAGCYGSSIAELVEKVKVMDYNGRIKTFKRSEIKFTYRASSLTRYIILSASLKFGRKNKQEIKKTISGYLRRRRMMQDIGFPNAGCIFKNLQGQSAGRLIDLCGLKGRSIRGACVSPRHANFILNKNKAQASDVLELMELVKREVKNKFNINLEPEIKIWR